jgi:NAD(P)-dependent dehydrogenase (short-subunit alcohol dehydrogenase family)
VQGSNDNIIAHLLNTLPLKPHASSRFNDGTLQARQQELCCFARLCGGDHWHVFDSKRLVSENSADNSAGASTGIGAATVRLLVQHGAFVVFGDVNTDIDIDTAREPSSSVTFVKCDVTKYDDLYQLFKQAHAKHGHVDHAISCAGIFEHGNWFDPNHTIESIKDDPGNPKTLDVNLIGTLYFSRIAAVFLRETRTERDDKSLTLLSSVNAFRDSPGLYLYQTSKHAIQGLMRSSRKTLYERDGIRVNAVCPGVTDTPMSAHIMQPFKDAGCFWQRADAVAEVIAGILTSTGMNGKSFYVEGGDAFEFEEGLYEAQPLWLGEEATRRLRANTEAVERGVLLPK